MRSKAPRLARLALPLTFASSNARVTVSVMLSSETYLRCDDDDTYLFCLCLTCESLTAAERVVDLFAGI